jgi:hypothetical protein
MTIDAVLTHHTNTYASGVARFNEILADHLHVPFTGAFCADAATYRSPLLSFKCSELGSTEATVLTQRLSSGSWEPQCFLHNWEGGSLERRMIEACSVVWAGNLEVHQSVAALHPDVREGWTPGLLIDCRVISRAEINVFSFGMAHKIQTRHFKRLRELLDASGRSYAVYVSSATHATSSVRSDQAVYQEMHDLFPSGLWFLGNLSDVAVYNRLLDCTYFASFFPHGVRANNTSIAAAMEHGAICITNLDEYSPREYRHMENILDINQLETLPDDRLQRQRLSVSAIETARNRSWPALAAVMQAAPRDALVRPRRR